MRLEIPRAPGTYVLVFHLARPMVISPGRLGTFRLDPGWYLYVGSARGPGGLAARIARHRRPAAARRSHWHIDALTAQVPIADVVWVTGRARMECAWARCLLAHPGARAPIPGFGASDCACPTHLIHLRGADQVVWALAALQKI